MGVGVGFRGGHIGKSLRSCWAGCGCEHNHVVERTQFHRYAFSQNHHAHDISRVVAGEAFARGLQGVCTSR